MMSRSALLSIVALILGIGLTGKFVDGRAATLRLAPETAGPSAIVQVQAEKQRKKRGERKGEGEGKSDFCRERCMSSRNATKCQQMCLTTGKAEN